MERNELEQIEVDLEDLKNAYNDVISAMNNLKDIEGLDEEYKQLDVILGILDDKRIDLEEKYERLEDEAYYKENELQWKSEKINESNEYWREAI